MALSVALQMDPIGSIDIAGDTSFALALEAQARGHALWYYTPDSLSLNEGRVEAVGQTLTLRDTTDDHFTAGAPKRRNLDGFDVILMRQDPPFDMAYIPLTHLLELLPEEAPLAPLHIVLHADDAAISLNFWVTPDIANLSPERGGLEIYTALPPADWAVTDYYQDKILIQKFLDGQEDQKQTIPYGANRAVLFNSKLFHGSDRPNFATDYESHRINITLLFGRR